MGEEEEEPGEAKPLLLSLFFQAKKFWSCT